MKKKIKTLRNKLLSLYSPKLTNGEHTLSVKWRADRRVFDVVIVGNGRYQGCTHSKEFEVGLSDHPHTLGQLFYGSRWM